MYKLKLIKKAKTPDELTWVLWPKEMEEAMGDRSRYRNSFKEWLESYKNDRVFKGWSYECPRLIAEDIYKPAFDRYFKDNLFEKLRIALIEWIVKYVESAQNAHKC